MKYITYNIIHNEYTFLLHFLIIVLNLNARVKEPIRSMYTNTCIGTDKETRYYRNSCADQEARYQETEGSVQFSRYISELQLHTI